MYETLRFERFFLRPQRRRHQASNTYNSFPPSLLHIRSTHCTHLVRTCEITLPSRHSTTSNLFPHHTETTLTQGRRRRRPRGSNEPLAALGPLGHPRGRRGRGRRRRRVRTRPGRGGRAQVEVGPLPVDHHELVSRAAGLSDDSGDWKAERKLLMQQTYFVHSFHSPPVSEIRTSRSRFHPFMLHFSSKPNTPVAKKRWNRRERPLFLATSTIFHSAPSPFPVLTYAPPQVNKR